MKGVWLVLFLIGFAGASVDVHNYSVGSDYFLMEDVIGEINLTISGEDLGSVISFGEQEILLEDFLNYNGADFECSPRDCEMGYEASLAEDRKDFDIGFLNDGYVGFVFEGESIVLESMDFRIGSDYGAGLENPLVLNFFEGVDWNFGIFSGEFLAKDWGCFDVANKWEGPVIGVSPYCEAISIRDSGALRVGADISGEGDAEVNMDVYTDGGVGLLGSCNYNLNETDGCEIELEAGDIFYEGDYWVCVSADSTLEGYNIYEEDEGESCGFPYLSGESGSESDFGIFAQSVGYLPAGYFGEMDFGEEVVDAANEFIEERYEGNCSQGCVLPLKFSGISQSVNIYDIHFGYMRDNRNYFYESIYDLEVSSAKVDFSGVLDLSLLGFVVEEEGEVVFRLGDELLFEEDFEMIPAPVISSVFPMDPPAGVPVSFYANVDFDLNNSLIYRWNFGDNSSAQTNVSHVVHVYKDLKNYTLTLSVSAGGNLTSEKSFEVEAISPEVAVRGGLKDRGSSLASLRSVIEGLPSWYGTALMGMIELVLFEDELERMERAFNNSFDAEGFKDIAVDLYSLNIPVKMESSDFEIPFLLTKLEDINIDPVAIISGSVSGAVEGDYVNPILSWQEENIDVEMREEKISVSYLNGEEVGVLSAYSLNISSKYDRESYFVINKPFEDLYFSGNAGARKAGDSTVVVLDAGERKHLDFYYKDISRLSAFVSPKLSSLVIESEVVSDCNYNFVCEKDAGEDYKNCRSDCKPVGKAITFFILGVLLFLVLYSGLQIWYKKNYENYLFKDSAQLYNLVMYVTNARSRGMKDNKIAAELRSKGWSSERVSYVIRKSNGKTVKMIELIPIEAISAWLRNRRARVEVKNAMDVAGRVQQQGNGY